MATGMAWTGIANRPRALLRATGADKHILVPRIIAGVPLLGIGSLHVFAPEYPMRPLVEAAGLPFAGMLSPIAVAAEITSGLLLLLGMWARVGALFAIPTMLVAVYAHFAIDVWPNGPENEPSLALPIIVMLCAAYVLWRGAGRWSFDWRQGSETARK